MVTATFRLISLLLSTLKKDRFLSSMLNATLELLSRSSPYSFLTIQELKWVCCSRYAESGNKIRFIYDIFTDGTSFPENIDLPKIFLHQGNKF